MGDVMDDDEVMQTPALLLNAVDEAATCLPDGYAAVQPTPLEWPAVLWSLTTLSSHPGLLVPIPVNPWMIAPLSGATVPVVLV